MVGGHRVNQQQLLQHIFVNQLSKVPTAPAFECLEELVHAGMVAGPDKGQKHSHFSAIFPIRGFSALAGGDVQNELLGIIDPQFNAPKLLSITTAQLLKASPQEA